jgi:hypothetical protein
MRISSVIVMFRVFINCLSLFVLALLDLSFFRSHFWPFTDVLRKIPRSVTRKMQRLKGSTSRWQRHVPDTDDANVAGVGGRQVTTNGYERTRRIKADLCRLAIKSYVQRTTTDRGW